MIKDLEKEIVELKGKINDKEALISSIRSSCPHDKGWVRGLLTQWECTLCGEERSFRCTCTTPTPPSELEDLLLAVREAIRAGEEDALANRTRSMDSLFFWVHEEDLGRAEQKAVYDLYISSHEKKRRGMLHEG
jgi:hypothetical protein